MYKNKSNEEILIFFKEILKIELDGAIRFIEYDLEDMEDEREYFKDRYSPEICQSIEWMSKLKTKEIIYFKRLVKLYTTDTFSNFFKRLEEGENIEEGERINFELSAVNEMTGKPTKLISATPDSDNVDNNFQEWILENCSEIED